MEDIPKIIDSARLPLDIPIRSHLSDHCFNNRSVLPAVEAVEILARSVKEFQPAVDVTMIGRHRFDKFLYLDPLKNMAAHCDISVSENGDVIAALATRTTSKTAGFSRVKAHVTVEFPQTKPVIQNRALDLTSALEGICFSVHKEQIYGELVPFGPSFQNITVMHMTPEGALAEIYAPELPDGPRLLGSPFVLDAAYHAACVWGQRHAGFVGFPVGGDHRQIIQPTGGKKTFFAHVIPVRKDPNRLVFDLRIYDSLGALQEIALGVQMRDASGGTKKPPQWIAAGSVEPAPFRIASRCKAFSVIDITSMTPFADKALSVAEKQRFDDMGAKRKKHFLAGHLACKRISRQVSGYDTETDPRDITTISVGSARPRCPLHDGRSSVPCSVAHDNKFAVAVAAEGRVGVDVEMISDRVLRSQRLYMSASESALFDESPTSGKSDIAVRVWSIKEAVTKALDINFADAWHRVRVVNVGTYESAFQIDEKVLNSAYHDVVGKHVFTLVHLP